MATPESHCTCDRPVSVDAGPSYPDEDCPAHGNPAVLALSAPETNADEKETP